MELKVLKRVKPSPKIDIFTTGKPNLYPSLWKGVAVKPMYFCVGMEVFTIVTFF